jgi:hypothetical protein
MLGSWLLLLIIMQRRNEKRTANGHGAQEQPPSPFKTKTINPCRETKWDKDGGRDEELGSTARSGTDGDSLRPRVYLQVNGFTCHSFKCIVVEYLTVRNFSLYTLLQGLHTPYRQYSHGNAIKTYVRCGDDACSSLLKA